MTGTNQPVVIIGGGLAGLACAAELHARSIEFLLVEAGDHVGGRVRTDHVEGFLLDRGFQVLLTAYPELERRVDLNRLDVKTFAPGASIVSNSALRVVADPLRAPLDIARTIRSTLPGGVATPVDLLRLLVLRRRLLRTSAPLLLRGTDVPTVDALTMMGFSHRFIRSFFMPFIGGVQLDPTLSTSSRMFDVIMRMLLTGSAGVPAAGMGALPAAIADDLPAEMISLGERVLTVSPNEVKTEQRAIAARCVVVATDGPAAAQMLDLPDPGSRSAGCVWFDIPEPPVDGRRIILDGEQTGPCLNAAVLSTVAPTYAPSGRHLIALATPGDVGPDLEERVLRQVTHWWGDRTDGWRHLRTDRITHGQPNQSPPFAPKQRTRLADGLYVCGDHRDTGSIQGALFSGRRCAEAVLEDLAT